MRKFIIVSLLLLTSIPTWACFAIKSTYNYYLFSVFGRETLRDDLYGSRTDAFWKQYSGGKLEGFSKWNSEEMTAIAQQKGDRDMVLYIEQLSHYLDICEQLRDTWTYPTKEQLNQRKQTLRQMITHAEQYRGSSLRTQWQLLAMRARFQLGLHEENINFWKETGRFLAGDVYRDMMYNLYAGSLLRTGEVRQATDIYAEQGDMVSIKWIMRKHRNIAGIKNMYKADLNSATMHFLIQDFVNNYQETIDQSNEGDFSAETLQNGITEIGAAFVSHDDARQFITFAEQVLAEGQTDSPALWLAAIGEIQYLQGNISQALTTLDRAMKAKGTQRMRDNARCIRMVASAKQPVLNAEYEQYIIGEMDWLVQKVHEENRRTQSFKTNEWENFGNHYTDVMQRLVYNNLVPAYRRDGKEEVAIALLSMMESSSKLYGFPSQSEQNATPDAAYQWNNNYNEWYSDYYQHIDSLSSHQLISYTHWMKKDGNTPMERFVREKALFSDDFFNDFIGTRLIAEGNFAEATSYLKLVPLPFMEQQNISYYLANRDFTLPRWQQRQRTPKGFEPDGPEKGRLSDNPKLRFCNEMLRLQSEYDKSRGEQRCQKAYDLATRLYQASYMGDCWYLSHYGKSVMDTVRTGEADFINTTIQLLNESKKSRNAQLRMKSLYALAFIPVDEWAEGSYDADADRTVFTNPQRLSKRWKALTELDDYLRKQPKDQPAYIGKCDVLRQFRKLR